MLAMIPLNSQNYYDVLGVPRYATLEDIRNAYEIARHTYKENSLATYSLFSDEENDEILERVSKAYEILFHPEVRREYDDYLTRLERHGGDLASDPFVPSRNVTQMGDDIIEPQASGDLLSKKEAPHLRAPASRGKEPGLPAPQQEIHTDTATVQASSQNAEPPQQDLMNDYADTVGQFNGAALRQARTKAGVEIGELAEQTKIRRAYIQYLEEENFEFLPAAVYVKGFVTIIAKSLSLPADKVAEEYMLVYHRQKDQ